MRAGDKPRVLVVGQLPPPVHGTTVMAERLLQCFSGIGVAYIFVERRFSDHIGEVGHFHLWKLPRAVGFFLRLARVAAVERGASFCVLFLGCSPGSFTLEACAALLLKRLGHRVVPYIHGLGFPALAASGRFYALLVKAVLASAERVVVLGQVGVRDVKYWVRPERIRIVPNTTEPICSSVWGPIEQRRDPERLRCLYLSTLEPTKGALEFVQAADRVARYAENVDFVLAGQATSDEYLRRIEAFVSERGLSSRVEILGPVYGKEKQVLLSSADLFVFPTNYRYENQPLVVLEAMRHGLPVISTRRGCIPEQVEEGVSGLLVDSGRPDLLAEAILSLCVDGGARRRMGEAGRSRFERVFSPAIFERRWREIVEELGTIESRGHDQAG